MPGSLAHRRIALFETRELELMTKLLESEGAEVVRCPMVTVQDAPDSAPINAWIRALIVGRFHDVILYTGEGVQRLRGFAERLGLHDQFIVALGQIRKITRGPKPGRALREIGLKPDLIAKEPTTAGLISILEREDLRNRVLGVQMYGQESNAALVDFIGHAGAKAEIVAPYVYVSDANDRDVQELIQKMASGQIDAIALTSSPQVARLFAVADAAGMTGELTIGLTKAKVAAIGPVVSEALARHGKPADVIPESYTMKPLVRAIGKLFAPAMTS